MISCAAFLAITLPFFAKEFTETVSAESLENTEFGLITEWEDENTEVSEEPAGESYRLKREETYDRSSGDLSEVILYEYNDLGLLQNKTYWRYKDTENGGYWSASDIFAYQYNEKQQLVKQFYPFGRVNNYFYDDYGNCIKEEYEKNTENWHVVTRTFDDNGSVLTELSDLLDESGKSLFPEGYKYIYDGNGRLLKEDDYFGHSETHSVTYEYDDAGNMVKKTDIYGDRVTVFTYTYDQNGYLISSTTGSVYSETPDSIYEYMYDENGNMQTVSTEGVIVNRYTYEKDVQKETKGLWREAYRNYLKKANDRDWNYVDIFLFYLDDDNIPEMYIRTGVYATGDSVCYYDGINVQEKIVGSSGRMMYYPEKGLFYYSGGHQGVYPTDVYEFKDRQLTLIGHGCKLVDPYNEGSVRYSWNDIPVSEQEYMSQIDMLVDPLMRLELGGSTTSRYLPVETSNPYSYDMMVGVLSNVK